MGNRKQPFGYKMSLGEIVIQESEAKLVQEVFRRYIAGESLNELTEALRQQDVPYDEGRLWNKNMIARILADTRYTGERGYPKLIDKEQLIAANSPFPATSTRTAWSCWRRWRLATQSRRTARWRKSTAFTLCSSVGRCSRSMWRS